LEQRQPPKNPKEARPDSSPDPSSARTNAKTKSVEVLPNPFPSENSFGKTESDFLFVKRGGGGAFSERTIQFRDTTRSARATSFVLKIGASLVQ